MINQFLSVSSISHFCEVTLAAVALSGIVLLLQALIFFAFQRLLIRSAVEAAYKR